MKMLRKSAALLLAAGMLTLTACGGNHAETGNTGEQTTSVKNGETKGSDIGERVDLVMYLLGPRPEIGRAHV